MLARAFKKICPYKANVMPAIIRHHYSLLRYVCMRGWRDGLSRPLRSTLPARHAMYRRPMRTQVGMCTFAVDRPAQHPETPVIDEERSLCRLR
jgi:hypothetical protein